MTDYQNKFQQLLRELFQFDCADLDFGVYRIMNHKRDVVERFITQDLPQAIAEELARGALAEQSQAAQELAKTRQEILETFEEDALDAEGSLQKYHDTKLGKRYLELQAKAASARSQEALEAAIYNHLYAFFSRYYQDGDFISKRRYSKRERYAIPYNGEEVTLYWANHDQYYIKTAEYFTDYTYKAPNSVTVHFKLQAADVEQDNVKGEKRFFLPRLDGIAWDEAAGQLVIPFEYRPLTGQEAITYGQRNQQEALLARAVAEIPGRLKQADKALAALAAERRTDSQGNPVSYLEHHLRQYTRRNTSDFFIHKDLKGFFSRELDFYLKNEVLNLEEMEAAGEGLAEGWFQLLRLIKAVGGRIIDFLAQIEDLQKMLWEKRKFITETFYCVTLGQIAEAFYPEIAANEAQWAEWRALYHIDDLPTDLFPGDLKTPAGRLAFLRAYPTLVLDTRHFPPDFVDRLLASYDDLDEMTDGLVVHGENWQALDLLLEKYRERVKCVYIDPPYNTGQDEFQYKDSYQHSSWMTMLQNRLGLVRILMNESCGLFMNIDDGEAHYLKVVCDRLFGRDNFVRNIVWQKRTSPDMRATLGDGHDHIMVFAKNLPAFSSYAKRIPKTYDQKSAFKNPDNDPRGPWVSSDFTAQGYRPNQMYKIVTPGGAEYFPPEGRCWKNVEAVYLQLVKEGRMWFGQDGLGVPRRKTYLAESEENAVWSWWTNREVGHNQEAKKESIAFFGVSGAFSTPKPERLARRIVHISSDKESTTLDFFAGSGTTGHAVINLNREDGGRRRFILVEMADYFDTVLLPRIKKVTFAPEWKDGQPRRTATAEEAERSPRLVKVIRLESYEDALNNIAFDEPSGQRAMQFDDYLLQYMLRWETRHSETLLNVEQLARPFAFQLHLHRDGETRAQAVDLPETFNTLLGLHVQTRRVHNDEGRRYLVYRGVTREGRKTAVIWRDTVGWEQADYERDKQFVAEHKLTEGADEIYVNGDSLIPGARALEGLFKARMFAEVEG